MLDLVFVGFGLGLFALTWWFVRFFLKLEEGSR